MKALVLEKYNHLVYKDAPTPEIDRNEVLVRVKACGICGSDVHGMDGSTGRRIPPLIMGHEASGIIVEKGGNVKNWNINDRVTFDSTIYDLDDWYTKNGLYNISDNRQVLGVSEGNYCRNGAFAEYVSIPQHILYKIPSNVSFEEAAMVEPVAVAAHALNISKIKKGDSALVIGAGLIGTFVIELLKLHGASPIIAVDKDNIALKKAYESGADIAFPPEIKSIKSKISERTENRGPDIVFEVVGLRNTINLSIMSVRKSGKVILVGNLSKQVEIPLQKIITSEIKLLGSCAINGEYNYVLHLIAEKKINVNKHISIVAPLSEGAKWFNTLYHKEKNLNKVILVP